MKNDKAILLLGGVAVATALVMTTGKKKAQAITSQQKDKELPPSQTPPEQEPVDEASGDEKTYIDYFYTLGLYKTQEWNVNGGQPPPKYIKRENESNAEWLTNIAYWTLYSIPDSETNANAPVNVKNLDHTNAWFITWMRMYGYAQKLFGKP